jgi:predicted nucleic acid-binding protein
MSVSPSYPTAAVVDASVLIKVFLPEEGSEAATRLIENAGDGVVRAVR